MTGRTLILSVDRDDDVGYKAGISTPAVGRDECLNAASKLGVADPEDSDTNAIFQAVKTYDELTAKGEDAQVAVISGNHLNMIEGDRRIAQLLDEVIEKTDVTECILISDGAEDEYILPIIQSRLKVSSVVRVTIKQLPNIEGTFYTIKKLFDDPKIAKSFLLPAGIILIIYALMGLFVPQINALLVALAIIGVYILFKGLGIDDYFGIFYHSIVDSFKKGRFMAIAYLGAIVIAFAGVIAGLMSMIVYYPNSGDTTVVYNTMAFLYGSVIWFVISGLIAAVGKIADYVQNDKVGITRIFILPFFIIAVGLISYGALIYFMTITPNDPFPFTPNQGIAAIIILSLIGLFIAFIGIYLRPFVVKRVNAWIEKRKKLEDDNENGKGKPFYSIRKY